MAREVAQRLDIPHIELDAIFHQADWTQLPDDEFVRRVAEATRGDSWVVDGNYGIVTRIGPVWERADTVIWVDPHDRVVMAQVIMRTLRRTLGREDLWNGNRESFRNVFRLDPQRSIIAWAWTTRARNRQKYTSASTDPTYAHLRFVRLRSRKEVRAFLDHLTTAAASTTQIEG